MNITERIDKYLGSEVLEEALKVEFNTRPFERSHMKKPSGRGSWAFSVDGELKDPEMAKRLHKDGKLFIYLSPSMTYMEAKKWFTAALKKELANNPEITYVEVGVEG